MKIGVDTVNTKKTAHVLQRFIAKSAKLNPVQKKVYENKQPWLAPDRCWIAEGQRSAPT